MLSPPGSGLGCRGCQRCPGTGCKAAGTPAHPRHLSASWSPRQRGWRERHRARPCPRAQTGRGSAAPLLCAAAAPGPVRGAGERCGPCPEPRGAEPGKSGEKAKRGSRRLRGGAVRGGQALHGPFKRKRAAAAAGGAGSTRARAQPFSATYSAPPAERPRPWGGAGLQRGRAHAQSAAGPGRLPCALWRCRKWRRVAALSGAASPLCRLARRGHHGAGGLRAERPALPRHACRALRRR